MKFDQLGLPADMGSTDFQDSARLAGLLTTFGWPQAIDCTKYVVLNVSNNELEYVRHPREYKYNFSRDQFTALAAGLFTQKEFLLVNKKYITGRDIFSPSQNGHVRICQGLKPTWLQRQWLWIDVLYSCYVKPLYEPNQLLCMMMVHPDKSYLKFWLKHNKYYREAIRRYWSTGKGAWRGEPELADHMIKTLEAIA